MKSFSSLGPLLKKLSYGERIHPSRDWLALLALTLALTLMSAAWNLWLFRMVQDGAALAEPAAAEAFDTASLDAVRKVFEDRKRQETRFESEYRFVDPSL